MNEKVQKEPPSLIEMEALRVSWIEDTLKSGTIDAAIRVAEMLGEDMKVPATHVGIFKTWKQDGVQIDLYKTTKSYSPVMNRFMTRTVVKIKKHSKNYAYLVLDESRNSLGNDEFVVPGEWEKTVWEFNEHVVREEEADESEQELKRRQYLANMLHIT